jgi:Uma2 family endonuclease
MSSVIQAPTEASEAPEPKVKSKRGEPTWEMARYYPRRGEWTEADYLALHTNQLIELSDGCLEFLPMPTIFHQLGALYIYKLLDAWVAAHAKGFVIAAPLRVRLWDEKIREPDIVWLRPERIPADRLRPPNGADLAVEVVSSGEESRKRDLVTKRDEYARAGIDESWIVDPEERHITVLTREGQTYREHGVYVSGQQATSAALPGFTLDVAAAFAAGEATP